MVFPPDISSNSQWLAKTKAAMRRGADVPGSKLTDEKVAEMRRLRVSGKSLNWLGGKYGVDPSTVDAICKGETWKHVFERDDCPTFGIMLSVSGQTKPNAKLNADDVRQIRKLLADGVSGKKVAAKFGVHKATISDIRCGKIWRDIS